MCTAARVLLSLLSDLLLCKPFRCELCACVRESPNPTGTQKHVAHKHRYRCKSARDPSVTWVLSSGSCHTCVGFHVFGIKERLDLLLGIKAHTHTPQDSIYSSIKPKTVQSPSDHYAFKALFIKTPKQNPSRPAKPVRAIRDHSMESSSISAVFPEPLNPCTLAISVWSL